MNSNTGKRPMPFSSSSSSSPSSSSTEDEFDLTSAIQAQSQALLTVYANNNVAMAYYMENMDNQANNPSHGGSVPGHRVIHRDRGDADRRLWGDYFSENPKYNETMFRRRFRMSRRLFLRIANDVEGHDNYFVQRRDRIGRLGLSTLQKVTAAFRILAYGVAADATDEYIQIGESTAVESLKRFCRAIVEVFGERYLRAPDANDVARLLQIGEERGFPGMLGSLDCMQWTWKNCPTAWAGQYSRRSGEPTIILEAVADYDLWIWHAHFGLPGSNNDINVLEASHLFANLANGIAPPAHYVIQGKEYNTGYYLADGIYPKWSTLVQTIHEPRGPKEKLFATMQETCRKDVERAFGVLQSRFAIVKGPARFWNKRILHDIMSSCIIMHNMIIEDERDEQANIQSWREAPAPEVDIARDETTLFQEFLARHRQIKDKEAHYALRNALIEHLWERYGVTNRSRKEMIKRRFYKLEHGDRDAPSESSSSSSDSEAEAEEMEEEEDDDEDEEQGIHSEEEYHDHKDNDAVTQMGEQNVSVSSSSGYESEDSSGNEVNIDKSDVLTSDDDIGTQIDQKRISQSHLSGKGICESPNIQRKTMSEEPDIPCENSDYILKCKSVFKCRICPRVVCLSDETLRAHLNSKRHARSEKLLKEGRLKLMLDDRGRIDGEEEHSPKIKKKTETTRTKGFKKQRWGKKSRKENEQYAGTQTGAKRRRKDDR